MDYFKILGIEQTKDKDLIKKAYMESLSLHNPEDDPEGFKLVRHAYEELMSKADEKDVFDESDSGIFMRKVIEVYKDFAKRIDPDVWKELLQEDVAFAIDTQDEVSNKLLSFIADNYYLPHSVFKVLENHFSWHEKQDELKQAFHPNFINYLISNSLYEDNIRYHFFKLEPDKDYDKFLSLFFQLERLINEGKKEEVRKIFDEIYPLGIQHPDLDILEIRYYLQIDDIDRAYGIVKSLLEEYEDDTAVCYAAGQVLLSMKDPDSAMPYFKKILDKDPDGIGGKKGLADCYFGKGEYEEAKTIYREILKNLPYDSYTLDRFYNTSIQLAKIYEEKTKENPEDVSAKLKLAIAYYNTYRFNECKELLLEINPDDYTDNEDTYKHYDLTGVSYMYFKDYDKAFTCFQKLLELNDKKINTYINLVSVLENMKRYDEALTYIENGMTVEPENVDLYVYKASVYFKQQKYTEALKVADEGLVHNQNMAGLYLIKADVFYKMGNFADALDNCRTANNIYPYITNAYLIQMKIFYDIDKFEQVLEVAGTVTNFKIHNADTKFYEGSALRMLCRYKESEELFLKMAEEDKNNPAPLTDLSLIYTSLNQHEKGLEYITKALDIEPGNQFRMMVQARAYRLCCRYSDAIKRYDELIELGYAPVETHNGKGLTCMNLGEYAEAEEEFKKVIAINEDYSEAYGNLGKVYEERADYEKAIEFYTKAIDIKPCAWYHINRGLVYEKLNKNNDEELVKKQIADYEKTIELDPEYGWAYNNLGHIYYEKGEYEKSVEYYEKAIEKDDSIEPAYPFICRSLSKLGRWKKVREYYSFGIEKFPANSELRALKMSRLTVNIFVRVLAILGGLALLNFLMKMIS